MPLAHRSDYSGDDLVRHVEQIAVDAISVLAGRRTINTAAVEVLSESMSRIGLQTPISVRTAEGAGFVLVAGAHRLTAARSLGWETIDCFVVDGDDVTFRMIEISENLHRAELSKLERDEQIAEWVRLSENFRDNLSENPQGGRPQGGAAAASRELGIDERDVQRAVKVAAMAPEAKEAVRASGLDDNRSVLLKVASAGTPQEQVSTVQKIAGQRGVDREKLEADLRSRALREAASIIVDHLTPDFLPALIANLDLCGGTRLAKTISKTRRRAP